MIAGTVLGRAHSFAEEIWWTARLNFCIIAFSALGLGLVGVAPASVAAAVLVRRHVRGEKTRLLREFFAAYRTEFVEANVALVPLGLATAGLLFSLAFFRGQPGSGVLAALAAAAAVFAALVWAVAVPLLAYYNVASTAAVLSASRFLLANPSCAALLALALVGVGIASWVVPGLIPFLSFGAASHVCARLGFDFFDRNERRLAAASARPA